MHNTTMRQKKKQQLRREVRNFSVTSFIATAIDYVILNVLTLAFHLPTIPSNLMSTTVSSIASYRMNTKVVFEGRRHSLKTTVFLYIAITATSIYVIQNICIYLIEGYLKQTGTTLPEFIKLNTAKMIGSLVAGIWNYLMLRRFVFIPETKKDQIQAAE